MVTPEVSNSILYVLFGAGMVVLYSWSRFDESSYEGQAEYFSLYKPRFSTSYSKYREAKLFYIFVMLAVYLMCSLSPDIYKMMTEHEQDKSNYGTAPLISAIAIISLQHFPFLEGIERRLRGFFHALAEIPERIRRTVGQMRLSEFTFESSALFFLAKRLGVEDYKAAETLARLAKEDDIFHAWCTVGSLLFFLSDKNRSKFGFDPFFFELYHGEFESIEMKYSIVTDQLRAQLASNSGSAVDSSILQDIRGLRERMYSFVACCMCCSFQTDVAGFDALRALGFINLSSTTVGSDLIEITGISFISLMIVTIGIAYLARYFGDQISEPLTDQWKKTYSLNLVPNGPNRLMHICLWLWEIPLYNFVSIIAALSIRHAKIVRWDWFEMADLRRRRPIKKYVWPTIFGAGFGCTLIVVITWGKNRGYHFNAGWLQEFGDNLNTDIDQSFPFFPLPLVAAIMALWLRDNNVSYQRQTRQIVFSSLICGSLMGLIVYFARTNALEFMSLPSGVKEIPKPVSNAFTHINLLMAFAMLVFSFLEFAIVQSISVLADSELSILGHYAQATSRNGPAFVMFLDFNGTASSFNPQENSFVVANVILFGQWRWFPGGIVVRWRSKPGDMEHAYGDLGLISSSGGELTYRGYRGKISAVPEFVAQLSNLEGWEA